MLNFLKKRRYKTKLKLITTKLNVIKTPLLKCVLANSSGGICEVYMHIDTGTDITAIPQSACDTLNLQSTGTSLTIGTAIGVQEIACMECWINILGKNVKPEKGVIPVPKRFGLIGCDILKDMRINLDGPKRVMSIEIL